MGLLLWSLLAYILPDHKPVLSRSHGIALRNSRVICVYIGMLGHVEDRCCLARVVDDVVIDVVVVDYVCNIAATLGLAFDTLLSWIKD